MMVAFVTENEPDEVIVRTDMSAVPDVAEHVEHRGSTYVVVSRRWTLGRLGPSARIVLRPLMETTG